MTIEIALLISGLSLAFAVYFGITNVKRNNKIDVQKQSSDMTTIIVKLDHLGEKITEMRVAQNNLVNDVKNTSEKIIILEQSLNTAWRQIDDLKQQKGGI